MSIAVDKNLTSDELALLIDALDSHQFTLLTELQEANTSESNNLLGLVLKDAMCVTLVSQLENIKILKRKLGVD